MKNDFLNRTIAQYDYPRIALNSLPVPENGLIFLYPSWSIDQVYLAVLLKHLTASEDKPMLYIYDIDSTAYKQLEKQYEIRSHGKGELFYIKEGGIVQKITSYVKEGADAAITHFLKEVRAEGAL